MRKHLAVPILAGFLLVGIACDKKASGPVEQKDAVSFKVPDAPKIDLSTPEKAIYTFQQVKNWEMAANKAAYASGKINDLVEEQNNSIMKVTQEVFSTRIMDLIKSNKQTQKKNETYAANVYEFSTEEMKKETDTRVIAMVRVKNVTPIPQDMEVEDYTKKTRQEGVLFKFVLELENGKWLVSDIFQMKTYSKEWEPKITKLKPWNNIGWVDIP